MGKVEKSKRPKSSFEVFMNHFNKNGAQGVFSYECYLEWTQTRKEPPKQPEESYRRTITAHICKSSGRRPFDPEVEKEILVFIRQKKPWPMSQKLGINIGLNGFRAKGYHESQSLKQESEEKEKKKYNNFMIVEQKVEKKTTKTQSRKKKFKKENNVIKIKKNDLDDNNSIFIDCKNSKTNNGEEQLDQEVFVIEENNDDMVQVLQTEFIDDSNINYMKKEQTPNYLPCTNNTQNEYFASNKKRQRSFDIIMYPNATQRVKHELLSTQEKDFLYAWFQEPKLLQKVIKSTGIDQDALSDPKDAQTQFVVNILKTFHPQQFEEFRTCSGFDVFSSAGLYMIENIIERRFLLETTKREFLCPLDQDSVGFEILGPRNCGKIGKILIDLARFKYVDTDKSFREIVCGDVTGKQISTIQQSQIHTSLLLGWAGPLLRSRGRVWTHMRFPDQLTGEYVVLRCLWEAYPGRPQYISVTVQDVSHLHEEYVRKETLLF